MCQKKVWRIFGMLLAMLVLCSLLAACAFTQSAFTRTANNAGSAFAAAEATLVDAHEGKFTYSYAASSFINYQSELSGTDKALTAQGASDTRTLHRLLALYSPAIRIVDAPCLNDTCDWHKQVEVLTRASQAFLGVGNS